MKKHLQDSAKENSMHSLGLEENPLIEWITRHAQMILFTLLGAFALFFIGYLWFAGSSTRAETDFLNASESFATFQDENDSTPEKRQEALTKLSALIAKQPDLGEKYDALIAQSLIARNDIKQAMPFATQALGRVSEDQIPFYVDYSQTTLLITEGHMEEAIQRSIALKEKMLKSLGQWGKDEKENSFGELLFAFNLLRIPLLQQHIEANAEERQSWEEWKSYFNPASHSLPAAFDTNGFYTVAQLFNEGSVSLDNYIDVRMQRLQEKS